MTAQILQITSVGTFQGQQAMNRWHFVDTSGVASPTTVLPAFKTGVLDQYKTRANQFVTWSQLIWRIITDPLSAQASYTTAFPITGTNTGITAPSYVALTTRFTFGSTVVLTAESPQRRIRRGGKRLYGLNSTDQVSSVVTAGTLSSWAGVVEAYLAMSTAGFVPCIAGFPKAPHPRPHPADPALEIPNKYALITGYSISANVGSQVSRKFGHGR